MELFGETLPIATALFLILALSMAFGFEFVNGFHDTANAVATVIYTHSLKPWIAVIWSGCWNLIGVLTSTGAVAFGVLGPARVQFPHLDWSHHGSRAGQFVAAGQRRVRRGHQLGQGFRGGHDA